MWLVRSFAVVTSVFVVGHAAFAETRFDFSAQSGIEYRSNLFNVANTPETSRQLENRFDDFISSVGAHTNIDWIYRNQRVQLLGDVAYKGYQHFTQLNHLTHYVAANTNGFITSDVEYRVQLRRSSQLSYESVQGVFSGKRNELVENYYQGSVSQRFGDFNIGFDLSNTQQRWTLPDHFWTPDTDFVNSELNLRYQRSETAKTRTFIAVGRAQFPHRKDIKTPTTRTGYASGVATDVVIAGQYQLKSMLGAKMTTKNEIAETSQLYGVYDLTFRWLMSAKNTLDISTKRNSLNNTLIPSNEGIAYEYGLRNHWQARHNAGLDAGLVYRQEAYLSQEAKGRHDQVLRFSTALTYLWRRNVSTSFDVAHEWRESSEAIANYGANSVRFVFKLLV